jgi:hypothetical protein
MFFCVSNNLKKKLCLIFQEIVSKHPIFEKAKVYTKFPQEERPKTAIVIRSTAGSSQKLGLDNFIDTQRAYSTVANLKGIYGYSIEWVKDDVRNIDKMSAAGFYVVKITAHDPTTNKFSFVVEPYLIVDDEVLNIQFLKGKEGAILKNTPVNPGSEIVYSQSHKFEFKPNIDYTIDYSTGEILFAEHVKDRWTPITVDYQVLAKRTGPFETEYYQMNNVAIPGVVIAFGDRLKLNDEQVVVVQKKDTEIAQIYGGRWILDFDIIVVAQDPDQQERLVDYVITSFWAHYQHQLANEGIALRDFSLSGEAEDLEVEIPEEYNFTGGISFSMETDWEVFVPMLSEVRRINTDYGEESFKNTLDYVTEENYEIRQYDERMYRSPNQKGLQISPAIDAYRVHPSPFPRVDTRKY